MSSSKLSSMPPLQHASPNALAAALSFLLKRDVDPSIDAVNAAFAETGLTKDGKGDCEFAQMFHAVNQQNVANKMRHLAIYNFSRKEVNDFLSDRKVVNTTFKQKQDFFVELKKEAFLEGTFHIWVIRCVANKCASVNDGISILIDLRCTLTNTSI